ncbi:hypothetical protein GCM10020370_46280 [Paenibacillus hodogayensis]
MLQRTLHLTELYHPISEREVDQGYIDIYLEKDFRKQEIRYEWLWESKYLRLEDRRRSRNKGRINFSDMQTAVNGESAGI